MRYLLGIALMTVVLMATGCVCRDMEVGRGCHDLNGSLTCGVPRERGTSRVKVINGKSPEYGQDYCENVKGQKTLADCGERYIRRGDYSVDISDLPPRAGEPYAQYRIRMMNTLALQEINQATLIAEIEKKTKHLVTLEEQSNYLHAQSVDLRLDYTASDEEEEEKSELSNTTFRQYTVQQDDTLQKIAFRYYGTHTGWLSIYRYNLERLPSGPNRILAGSILYLPAIELIHTRPAEMEEPS